MDKKEYDKGYKAAIEAIKKALKGENSGQGSGGDSGLQQPPVPGNNKNQQNNSGSQDSGDQSSGNDQNSRGNGSQGVVRPEDCIGPDSLNNIPDTPGVFMPKSEGDKIAEEEGYSKEGGSDSTIEKDWADASLKASSQMKGDEYAKLKSKIEAIYKTSTNWKKELRQIVGMSLSPEDTRSAYANKNVLISQNRIARTEKDKYDNVDYIMAWIDSSGSMSDEQLRLCLSEVYSVALKKKPIKIVVVQCDTQIQDIKEYTNLRELQRDFKTATVKGRGGTELKPCWNLLKEDKKYKRISPELVMIFTDGYLNQYKRDPRTMRNLCWVILDNPSFDVKYKDAKTKCVYINTKDVK